MEKRAADMGVKNKKKFECGKRAAPGEALESLRKAVRYI